MKRQRNQGGTVTWGSGAGVGQATGFWSTMLSSRQGYEGKVGVTRVRLRAGGRRRAMKGLGVWVGLGPWRIWSNMAMAVRASTSKALVGKRVYMTLGLVVVVVCELI